MKGPTEELVQVGISLISFELISPFPSRQEPRLTLQDAFRRRKKKFIRNSETRLQEFKDVYQRGKHGAAFDGKGNYLDGNIAVERPQGIKMCFPLI